MPVEALKLFNDKLDPGFAKTAMSILSTQWILETIHEPATVIAGFTSYAVLTSIVDCNQQRVSGLINAHKLFTFAAWVCFLNGEYVFFTWSCN